MKPFGSLRIFTITAGLSVASLCAAPVHADQMAARAFGGVSIHGPACRLASCCAVVMDAEGQAMVVRGRGYVRTLHLAEEEARLMAARAERHRPEGKTGTCIVTGAAIEL